MPPKKRSAFTGTGRSLSGKVVQPRAAKQKEDPMANYSRPEEEEIDSDDEEGMEVEQDDLADIGDAEYYDDGQVKVDKGKGVKSLAAIGESLEEDSRWETSRLKAAYLFKGIRQRAKANASSSKYQSIIDMHEAENKNLNKPEGIKDGYELCTMGTYTAKGKQWRDKDGNYAPDDFEGYDFDCHCKTCSNRRHNDTLEQVRLANKERSDAAKKRKTGEEIGQRGKREDKNLRNGKKRDEGHTLAELDDAEFDALVMEEKGLRRELDGKMSDRDYMRLFEEKEEKEKEREEEEKIGDSDDDDFI